MAKCHACGQEITYPPMMKGVFRYWRKNTLRRTLPIFDCPHCGTQCQESAVSAYTFIALCLGAGVVLFTLGKHLMDPAVHPVGWVLFLVALCALAHYLWWRWLARLKEPHEFWWE
ncbi:hypothetical protein [Holophaga foetida]|uniref:hypothetical protein n=1 Tax=Holophaga foetida TaxID=35839 RepID=UPI00024720F3|nr:hypothetical protein [Holophaga foetida]